MQEYYNRRAQEYEQTYHREDPLRAVADEGHDDHDEKDEMRRPSGAAHRLQIFRIDAFENERAMLKYLRRILQQAAGRSMAAKSAL